MPLLHLLPLEIKLKILEFIHTPTDYLMTTYALNIPFDYTNYNQICYEIGNYPQSIKWYTVENVSEVRRVFFYTREIDPSSGEDVFFTKIYINSIIGINEDLVKTLKYYSDDYNYIAMQLLIDELIDLQLIKLVNFYKSLLLEIERRHSV